MKILTWLIVVVFMLSPIGTVYCDDVEGEDRGGSGNAMGKVLTGVLLGGLLGGGVGAAIGSASGHAGTGAAIGAGVGAVGGSLVGASQADSDTRKGYHEKSKSADSTIPKGAKAQKKVIRTYDEKGNLISEEEVKN